MALKDFIVPKWKHSKVEVRLAAVSSINNDRALLAEIAKTDVSPEVRIAALQKIDDEMVLNAIIDSDSNEQIKKIAQKKLETSYEKVIATSRDPEAIAVALEKYDNEKVTATYLCEHPADSAMQKRLLPKIKNPQLLCKLTEHACSLETSESILGIIQEKEYLERIAQKASNKKIRILAKKKIDALYPDPLIEQRAIAIKLDECCKSLDWVIESKTIDQGIALLESSRNIWNEYDPERKHPFAVKFTAAEKFFVDQIERCTSQKSLLDILESLSRQSVLLENEPIDSVLEKLNSLQEQWNLIDLSGLKGIDFETSIGRFTSASSAIKNKILWAKEEKDSTRRKNEELDKCCTDLEKLTQREYNPDSRDYSHILSTWEKVSSSAKEISSVKKRFADLQKSYEEKAAAYSEHKEAAIKNDIDYVHRLASKMQSASEAKPHQIGALYTDVIKLKREWEKHYPLAQEAKKELESKFSLAFELFMDNYYEFKEQDSWKQWAHENVKSKILAEIELFESKLQQGDTLVHLARKVMLFENQWKQAQIRYSEKSKELDARFNSSCNRIFSLGFAKKGELLETLKTTISIDADHDISDEIKNIQKQWNDIGYLPAELEKECAETFYSLCNTFFEQRKERYQKYTQELQENIVTREEICKESEKIATSDSWKETINSFTELQKKWDESWPAPMNRSRELWQQFSKNRDLFFERYDAFKQTNDTEKEQLCDKAEQLLAIAESLESAAQSTTPPSEEVLATEPPPSETSNVNINRILHDALELQKKWKASGPGSSAMGEKLWNRFNPAMKKTFAIIKDEQSRNFALKEALVIQAEALVTSDDWEQASQNFVTIRNEWKQIKPASRRDEQQLWIRLQTAGDTFFDRRRKQFDERKNATLQQIKEKELLISELELLVRISGKSHLLKNLDTESSGEILKKGIDLKNELDVEGDPKKTAENIRNRAFDIIDKLNKDTSHAGKEQYRLFRKFDELINILQLR